MLHILHVFFFFFKVQFRASDCKIGGALGSGGLILSSNSFRIPLPPFSAEELCRLISVEYGRIAPFARKLVSLYGTVKVHYDALIKSTKRILTTV